MEWSEEIVLQLINLYHSKELLWNPKHSYYKIRPKRFDAISDIASEIGTTTAEIERKLKNVTSHYYREKKRVDDSKKFGSGTEDLYLSKWFAYKSLDFLRNKNTLTPTKDTEIFGRNDSQSHEISESNDSLLRMTAETYFTQPSKRQKKNEKNEMVSEPISISKNVSQRQSETQNNRDEDTLFGDYIVAQLRKMPPATKAIARHRINNIIFEAETEYLSINTSETFNSDGLSIHRPKTIDHFLK